ncbi:polymorphic toxin-type HINT domain-containing protein [Moraxella catarrhalis]|nr:polymorphic toxin-type HINT domain-containing protein [Moraxella catarrhalis]
MPTTQPPQTVYNFEVQDFHTYHVGVWVHNADCCGLLQKKR